MRTSKAKLTEGDVLAIRGGNFAGWTQTAIAEHFGVSDGLISHVLHRIAWTHLDDGEYIPPPPGQAKGERNGRVKLTEAEVIEIRSGSFAGKTHGEIAERFGVSATLIGNILHRKTWTHI